MTLLAMLFITVAIGVVFGASRWWHWLLILLAVGGVLLPLVRYAILLAI